MTQPNINFQLEADDKLTPVMIYTLEALSWGQMVTKESMMATRVLTSGTVPDYISLYDAQRMSVFGGKPAKPDHFEELHIPVPTIKAFHLMPPAEEPLDYDDSVPNRIMAPLKIYFGAYMCMALVRISNQATVKKHLDIAKAQYLSIYDAKFCIPSTPQMKPIEAPMALVQRDSVLAAI
ncbi:hypothetical protein ACFLYP_00790 [Chloroflexota bacterium]